MRENSLSKIWEGELSRIVPQRDPSDFSDIIYLFQDYIARFIEKIFNAGNALPSSHITAKWILVGVAAAFVAALLFLLWRRFGYIARGKAAAIIAMRKADPLSIEYAALVSGGDYARAIRFFVRATGEMLRLQHRTFSELFYANTNAVISRIRLTYGRAVHLDANVSSDDLRSLEEQAFRIHPSSSKKISPHKRGGRS